LSFFLGNLLLSFSNNSISLIFENKINKKIQYVGWDFYFAVVGLTTCSNTKKGWADFTQFYQEYLFNQIFAIQL
jgi:hypothetical protein